MVIFSIFRHYRLRLMRPHLSFCRQRAHVHCAHPWPQPYGRLSPCKSSVLPICPSTVATAILSVPVSSTGQAPAPAGGKNPARSSHHLVRNPGWRLLWPFFYPWDNSPTWERRICSAKASASAAARGLLSVIEKNQVNRKQAPMENSVG